jgi:hypothetical protein
MPDEQPPVPDPTPLTPVEAAYETGTRIGRLYLRFVPKHEQHSDVGALVSFTVAATYTEIANGALPVPTIENATESIPLVQAYINGIIDAYNAQHRAPPPGSGEAALPPFAPGPSNPKDDGMPPMYG